MDEPKVAEKPESIRDWYERTTKNSRIGFVVMTIVAFSIMAAMWIFASMPTLSRIQTFNGALTVPLIGGLWIFAFIFMFLVPSREASFRAQEAIEGLIAKAMPAIKVWERLGLQVEKEYPEVRKKVEESLVELRKTAVRVEKALEDNAAFVTEAKPVLEALKRIEDRIEADLLDDMKDMVEAVKRMSGVPPAAPKAPAPAAADSEGKAMFAPSLAEIPADREPKLGVALSSIRKKSKEKEAAEQPK